MVSGRSCKMLTCYSDNWGERHPRNTCLNTVFQSERPRLLLKVFVPFFTTNRFSILLRQNVFIFYSKLNMDVILFCSTEVQYAKNVKILWSKLEKLYQQMSFRGFATKERILLTLELNAWIDQSVINDCWNNTEHPFPFKVFSNDNTSKSYLYVIFLFSLDRWLFKFWF